MMGRVGSRMMMLLMMMMMMLLMVTHKDVDKKVLLW